jgi:hypothetical protein
MTYPRGREHGTLSVSPTGTPIRKKNIMAKSSVPGLDRVRELFTSAERALLEATAGSTLLAASRKQLDKTLAQARGLRDKWRDLHAGQARTTKRSAAAGTAAANARSREKADMFTAAIERLEGRLAELGLVAAPAKPAGKSVTKAARQAGHRTARASVKGKLAATAAEMNSGRAPRPAAKPAARPATAVAAAVPQPPAAPAPVVKSKSKAGKKRRPAATAAAVLAKGGGQPLRFDVTKQRSAKASATAARMKFDGKVTRRTGHTLAAGKRRQAARDHRSR